LLILAPKPMKNRPARYIASGWDAGGKDWIRDPMMMNPHPIAVPCLLPSMSAMYGANIRTASPPNPGIAPKMPSRDPIGCPKSIPSQFYLLLCIYWLIALTILPGSHGLEPVQDTSVISKRGGSKEEKSHHEIELPKKWLLPPRNCGSPGRAVDGLILKLDCAGFL
jgi:hypothetical protein